MRRKYRWLILVAATISLLGVLGSGAGSPTGAATRANPGYSSLADAPMLPRDFTLPTPLFAPDSAWNQTATGAAVLPESDQQILVTYRVLHGDTTSLYPPGPADWFPVMWVNFDEYTMPIFRAGSGQ
ncbi:MAG: hypothetical protein ACE5HA_16040, partial [Anaerolineae bacterium]